MSREKIEFDERQRMEQALMDAYAKLEVGKMKRAEETRTGETEQRIEEEEEEEEEEE